MPTKQRRHRMRPLRRARRKGGSPAFRQPPLCHRQLIGEIWMRQRSSSPAHRQRCHEGQKHWAAGLQRAGAPRCCLAPYSALLRDASQHQCGGCKCPRRECRQVVPRAVRPAQFHAVIWPSPAPCIAQPRGSPTEETQGTDAWAAWQPSVAAATQKWIGCPFRCLGAAITHSPLKKLPCFSLYPLPRETDVPVPFQTCCLSVK